MTENSIIKIDCKYYLPCGRCDKTNEMCSQYEHIVFREYEYGEMDINKLSNFRKAYMET